MSLIQKIEDWGDKHHPKWLDVLRILLGLVIFLKGVQYVGSTDALVQMMDNSKFPWVSFGLAHYVAFAHLVGGLLIMMGLITRFAIVCQLPILIGAVVFINAQKGFFSEHNSELSFSLIVLFLLLFFFVEGSGPFSVDQFMNRHHNV